MKLKLLPYPRFLKRHSGTFVLPARAALHLDPALPRESVLLPLAERLQSAAKSAGVELELITGPAKHPRLAIHAFQSAAAAERTRLDTRLEMQSARHSHWLPDEEGLRAGVATLRQLLREHGRRLPCLRIRDHADFTHRGLMLDISRGRVPRLETLMELAGHLADFKINELQLYTEHTFAYRNYEPVWRDWGALTGEEILKLDAHCRQVGH